MPRYTYLPLISMVVANFFAYYGSRLFTSGATRLDLSIGLDALVPFCKPFIVIYILAYLQWIVGFILIARESRDVCYRIMSSEVIAKLICLVFFVAVPTVIERPEVQGNGVFDQLVRLIYWTDEPINLLPSIHCIDSWFCYRGARELKKSPRWYAPASLVMTLMVFASTVLVKQHVVVDIPAALLVAEGSLFIAARLKAGSVYGKIQPRYGMGEGAGR